MFTQRLITWGGGARKDPLYASVDPDKGADARLSNTEPYLLIKNDVAVGSWSFFSTPLWLQSHHYMQSAPRINLGQASEASPPLLTDYSSNCSYAVLLCFLKKKKKKEKNWKNTNNNNNNKLRAGGWALEFCPLSQRYLCQLSRRDGDRKCLYN